MTLKTIATFHSPFNSKFGIPKQSGLIEELTGKIVLEPDYRDADHIRGIEGFDFLWLVWQFSANKHSATSPLVRPPLLGGNEKVGVFASRSPFRPNAIGLSSVRLLGVDRDDPRGPVLLVGGADLMDDTPIFDIKPYVTYTDCHERARSGFVDSNPIRRLKVFIPEDIIKDIGEEKATILSKTLELDPRPHYHTDGTKVYGMPFFSYDVHFTVDGDNCTVIDCQTL